MFLFRDRVEAGRILAEKVKHFVDPAHAVVLALPRGGVPVGFEVARYLKVPLDIFIVRKLGVPGHEELALGALASGGLTVFNSEIIENLGLKSHVIQAIIEKEKKELARREILYRGNLKPVPLQGKTVVLVDDGLATGATMRAAALSLKKLNPQKIIIAVPVGASDTCESLEEVADEVVCAAMPEPFFGVGHWYEDFSQTTDEEVRTLLEEATHSA